MTEFFENNFADFSGEVLGKIKDFVQPLVAFLISNISYSLTFYVFDDSMNSCSMHAMLLRIVD